MSETLCKCGHSHLIGGRIVNPCPAHPAENCPCQQFRPAAPSSTETRCALCGDVKDAPQHQPPNRYGRHDFAPARPASPVEPEGETPSDGALERMNEWDSRVDDAAAEADLRTVRAELTALRAVREAAERVAEALASRIDNAASHGVPVVLSRDDAVRYEADLRRAIASTRPANGETEADMTPDQRRQLDAIQAVQNTPIIELLATALASISKHSGGWPMRLCIEQGGRACLVNDNGGTHDVPETKALTEGLRHQLRGITPRNI